MCETSHHLYDLMTEKEITEALSTLNKGKAADIFGATTEDLLYADRDFIPVLSAQESLVPVSFHSQ